MKSFRKFSYKVFFSVVSILILSVSTGYGNEDIFEIYDQPCLYVVNSSGSVDYYMLDELAAFIQNNVSKPSDTFDNLSSVTYDPSCWAILFISNEEALTSMNEGDRIVLKNAFDNGIGGLMITALFQTTLTQFIFCLKIRKLYMNFHRNYLQ